MACSKRIESQRWLRILVPVRQKMRNPRKERRRCEQCWWKAKTRFSPFPRPGLDYSDVIEIIGIRVDSWFKIWPWFPWLRRWH